MNEEGRKYLMKGKTQDGYYMEIMMMLLSGTFSAKFKIIIEERGLVFYNHNENLMINVDMDGFDSYFAHPSQIGKEIVVESIKKNHQLSNNKKKDSAVIFITRENPIKLMLQIRDSSGTVCMDIPYAIKNTEDDDQRYVVPDFRNVNPNLIIDAGELVKSLKINIKNSARHVKIKSHKKGIKLIPIDTIDLIDQEVKLGKWKRDESEDNIYEHIISKDGVRAIMKFFNLGKRVKIYSNEDYFALSLNIPNLGKASIIFKDVDPTM